MIDHNEPRMRTVYSIPGMGERKCCAAHTAQRLYRSRPATLTYRSEGRDYCDLWKQGGCDSDPEEINRTIAQVENEIAAPLGR